MSFSPSVDGDHTPAPYLQAMDIGKKSWFWLAALACTVASTAAMAQDKPPPALAPVSAPAVAAWRVECVGDGKALECQALQQLFRVENQNRQLVVQLGARLAADTHQPVLTMQLPLGINVAEPIQLKIDGGASERHPLQTCTANGCFATVTLNEKLLAALRAGTTLKITVQDGSKHSIDIDVPLLGFGLAFDKATK
jgi:invasion protein IalB